MLLVRLGPSYSTNRQWTRELPDRRVHWTDVEESYRAAKPSRQLGWLGFHPNSAFALAFDAPRDSVIIATAAGLATSLPIHAGTLRGGLAPTVLARYGSHSFVGAGSSSTML